MALVLIGFSSRSLFSLMFYPFLEITFFRDIHRCDFPLHGASNGGPYNSHLPPQPYHFVKLLSTKRHFFLLQLFFRFSRSACHLVRPRLEEKRKRAHRRTACAVVSSSKRTPVKFPPRTEGTTREPDVIKKIVKFPSSIASRRDTRESLSGHKTKGMANA